jgi:hypothetical protein
MTYARRSRFQFEALIAHQTRGVRVTSLRPFKLMSTTVRRRDWLSLTVRAQ